MVIVMFDCYITCSHGEAAYSKVTHGQVHDKNVHSAVQFTIFAAGQDYNYNNISQQSQNLKKISVMYNAVYTVNVIFNTEHRRLGYVYAVIIIGDSSSI